VPPQLSDCIAACVQRGQTQVAIQPYFLFPGGITEAISQEIDQLRLQFAPTQLHMGQPLNQAPEFTRLVLDGLIST
jgi:sirohydrochlorin ferrochelatase